MSRLAASFLVILLLITTPCYSEVADFRHIDQAARPSVVFLEIHATDKAGRATRWTGSGFIVTWSGHILTNSHVVPSQDQFASFSITAAVGSRHARSYPVEVIDRNVEIDLALVKLPKTDESNWKPLELGDPSAVVSQSSLLVLGYPLGLELSSSPGTVSHTSASKGRWQVAIPINPGQSGGPVLDMSGKVVAVVVGGIQEAQQINYVIPIHYANLLLNPFIAEMQTPYNAFYAKAKVFEKAGKTKDYVEALEGLLQNDQAFVSFDKSERLRQQANLHFEIVLALAGVDYVEGLADLEDRALVI